MASIAIADIAAMAMRVHLCGKRLRYAPEFKARAEPNGDQVVLVDGVERLRITVADASQVMREMRAVNGRHAVVDFLERPVEDLLGIVESEVAMIA